MTTRAARLATKANERLARLGGEVPPGNFVCPTCLRLLSVDVATEGHYPARSAPAVQHRIEVQCADCNNRIGATYESAGVDFIRFVRTVTMARPDRAGPTLTRQAMVRSKDGSVSVELMSRSRRRAGRHSRHAHTQLDRVLEGSTTPREMAVSISRPTDEAAKRAMLAWSFLSLFYYAGYRYAASPGAEQVRRLILDPSVPLPEGVLFTKGSIEMPLARPEPVVVVLRDEDRTVVEAIAMGVLWDRLVVVFPFANDRDDRAWRRVSQLLLFDELRTTDWVRLRRAHESMSKELMAPVEFSDGEIRRAVNVELAAIEVQSLAAGVSPRRLDPKAGGTWRTPMRVEHEFITVEGKPPEPARRRRADSLSRRSQAAGATGDPETNGSRSPRGYSSDVDRVAYWRTKFLAMPGGFLPRLVGQLLDEIPAIPRPIPDPPPVSMERSPEGWIATLHFTPDRTRAFGVSPADAVASLLAKAEWEFAGLPDRPGVRPKREPDSGA